MQKYSRFDWLMSNEFFVFLIEFVKYWKSITVFATQVAENKAKYRRTDQVKFLKGSLSQILLGSFFATNVTEESSSQWKSIKLLLYKKLTPNLPLINNKSVS